MNKICTLIACIAVIFTGSIFANESTGPVQITKISNWVGTANNPNEELLIQTSGDFTNPALCTATGIYFLGTASKVSQSMILTAYASNRPANLVIWNGGCSDGNRPVVVQVTLE